MAEKLILIDPDRLEKNPDNPRLIFHQEELEALQDSISSQGILVPLTVYKDGNRILLLDGERRWRCALKLGLPKVPVIIQPKPERLQNIMMMFAIHNARKDWDPLPTAMKLQDLEQIFTKQQKRSPTEKELAELASLTRGEVRRLKKLLGLPEKYRKMLLGELEKPRSLQVITVDHVLEATKGAESLRKQEIIDSKEEDHLRNEILNKFRTGVINNTVAPRQLAKIARAVGRKDVSQAKAKQIVHRIIHEPKFSIDDAYSILAKRSESEHHLEQLIERTIAALEKHAQSDGSLSPRIGELLEKLNKALRHVLKG